MARRGADVVVRRHGAVDLEDGLAGGVAGRVTFGERLVDFAEHASSLRMLMSAGWPGHMPRQEVDFLVDLPENISLVAGRGLLAVLGAHVLTEADPFE